MGFISVRISILSCARPKPWLVDSYHGLWLYKPAIKEF